MTSKNVYKPHRLGSGRWVVGFGGNQSKSKVQAEIDELNKNDTQTNDLSLDEQIKLLEDAKTAAYNDRQRHDHELNRMYDTGDSIYPAPIDESLQEKVDQLAKQYPRAAIYLRAKSYTYASNDRKVTAGKKAMTLIMDGGNLDEAIDILDNWSPGFFD